MSGVRPATICNLQPYVTCNHVSPATICCIPTFYCPMLLKATKFVGTINTGTPLASVDDLDDSTSGNEPLW